MSTETVQPANPNIDTQSMGIIDNSQEGFLSRMRRGVERAASGALEFVELAAEIALTREDRTAAINRMAEIEAEQGIGAVGSTEYNNLFAETADYDDRLAILRADRSMRLQRMGSTIVGAATGVWQGVRGGIDRVTGSVMLGASEFHDRYSTMDAEKKKTFNGAVIGVGMAAVIAYVSHRYGAAHPNITSSGLDFQNASLDASVASAPGSSTIDVVSPGVSTSGLRGEVASAASTSTPVEAMTPAPSTGGLSGEIASAPSVSGAESVEAPAVIPAPSASGGLSGEVASAPNATTRSTESGITTINTNTTPNVTTVTSEAQAITPGEGWFKTFQDMGIHSDEWQTLLQKAGPQLRDLKGTGYPDGLAYPVGDSWGIRITPDGKMPQEAFDIIQAAR